MKRTLLIHELVILLIILCALSPTLTVMAVGIIAYAFGCPVNEGFVQPCMVFGFDIGESIYSAGALGWYGLLTLPLGLVVLVVYILVALVSTLKKRKR